MSSFLTPAALANTTGSDTQNFNAAVSIHDYITSQSAKTHGAGHFSLGLFLNYSQNTAPFFEDANNTDSKDTSKKVTDRMTGADLVASLGITDSWDLSIAAPYVLSHSVDSDDFHGEFEKSGNLGIRAGTKFRLLELGMFDLAASGSIFADRVSDNPYEGASSSPSYAVEVIPEFHFGIADVALNLGYRWRNPDDKAEYDEIDNPIEPTENQAIASLATAFHVSSKTDVIGEIYGSQTQGEFSDLNERDPNVAEGLLGLRQKFNSQLVGHLGIGSEIKHSLSSADARVYAGVHWTTSKAPRAAYGHRTPQVVTASVPSNKPQQITIASDILFKFNSSQIVHQRARTELAKIAKLTLPPRKLQRLVIDGHTCNIGSDSYNYKLSQRRAASVKRYLASEFRLPAHKISIRGFGEAKPMASNRTPKGRKLNRRVEFKIYYDKPAASYSRNP